MDVILKRRLVGAAVIGLIAMVVVPMLLDGPDWKEQSEKPAATTTRNAEGERVVSVPLYGNARIDEPSALRSEPSAGSRSSGSSATNSNEEATGRAQAERDRRVAEQAERRREESRRRAEANRLAAERRQETERRAVVAQQQVIASNQQASTAARDGWAVQLGTFSSSDNANRLLKKLEAADWPAWIAPVTNRSGKTFYRVRVGPEESRTAADKSAILLAKQFSLQPRVMDIR